MEDLLGVDAGGKRLQSPTVSASSLVQTLLHGTPWWCWQGERGFPSPIQPLAGMPGEATPKESWLPMLVLRCLYHGWDAESQPGDEVLGTSSSPEGLLD